jgi:hypothetical protein
MNKKLNSLQKGTAQLKAAPVSRASQLSNASRDLGAKVDMAAKFKALRIDPAMVIKSRNYKQAA